MGPHGSSDSPGRKWWPALFPLLVSLFYAPLAWGATTRGTVAILDGLFIASFLGWSALLILERRFPRFSLWAGIPLVFVTVLGLISWANPVSTFDEKFWALRPTETAISWLPGSADRASTGEVVVHLVALLLGFLVLLDACAHSRIRWLFLKGLAVSGFVIALIGITQKAAGAEAMLWVEPDPLKYGNKLFFAAFRYHANAAAFLNLCWPAAMVVFLRERDSGREVVAPSIWATILIISILGVFINTSKAGQVLGAIGVVIALIRFRSSIFVGSKIVMTVAGILLLGLTLVFAMPVVSKWQERWSSATTSSSFGGRVEAYATCLRMLPDNAVYGSGPGTFRLVFPFYVSPSADRMVSEFFWYHAHQDYLQTAIEWGIFGALAWFIFYAGGLIRGFQTVGLGLKRGRIEYSVSCALIGMIIVMLHAMVDFPFQIPALQLPVAVYMAILFASGARKKAKRPAEAGLY